MHWLGFGLGRSAGRTQVERTAGCGVGVRVGVGSRQARVPAFLRAAATNSDRPENLLRSPVPVRSRHSELADRLALEVEFDQDRSLITDNPAIMTGLDDDDLRSRKLDSAAVRILDVDLAAGQEPDVRVHAEIGADDRFHVFGPAKSRRVDDAFHATGAGSNNINLGAADFAAFATGDGREKWIIDIHETSTRALPSPLNSIRAGWRWGLVLAGSVPAACYGTRRQGRRSYRFAVGVS